MSRPLAFKSTQSTLSLCFQEAGTATLNNKVYYVDGRLGCCAPVCVYTVYTHTPAGCVFSIHVKVSVFPSLPSKDVFSCVGAEFLSVFTCLRFLFGVDVNTSASILIPLRYRTFPGLKCQLSAVNLGGFCSVWCEGKQTVFIYCCSADKDRSKCQNSDRRAESALNEASRLWNEGKME